MLINRTKDSANSWFKQGENREVKNRENQGLRFWGGDSVAVRAERIVSKSSWRFAFKAFSSASAVLTSLLQLGLIFANNIKRRATCLWTRKKGKSVLGPCSEPGSLLATWNSHPIRVLLLMSLVTVPTEITFGSSTNSSTCLDAVLKQRFEWCACRWWLNILNLIGWLFGSLLLKEANLAPKYPR